MNPLLSRDLPRRPSDWDHTNERGQSIPRIMIARWLYWSRGVRPARNIEGLYGEPVWDVLLDLYIAHKSERSVSVTSLCLASRVPPTTALRYVTRLENEGWLYREVDTTDHRRDFMHISKDALQWMDRYFDRIIENLWQILPDSLVSFKRQDIDRLCAALHEVSTAMKEHANKA